MRIVTLATASTISLRSRRDSPSSKLVSTSISSRKNSSFLLARLGGVYTGNYNDILSRQLLYCGMFHLTKCLATQHPKTRSVRDTEECLFSSNYVVWLIGEDEDILARGYPEVYNLVEREESGLFVRRFLDELRDKVAGLMGWKKSPKQPSRGKLASSL